MTSASSGRSPIDTYALELAAVDSVKPGEVVVCATGNSQRSGIWGELLMTAALQRGAVGLVTDGAVRDLAQIRSLGFPGFLERRVRLRQLQSAKNGRLRRSRRNRRRGVAPEVLAFARRKASQEDGFRAAVQGGMPLLAAYKKFKVL
jgi:regulator of RNase E activity RraA